MKNRIIELKKRQWIDKNIMQPIKRSMIVEAEANRVLILSFLNSLRWFNSRLDRFLMRYKE